MAYSSEIIAKLGLDSSAFSRDLQALPDRVAAVGSQATRALEKTFRFESVFKGLLTGFGIGSAVAIFDKIATSISGALDHASKLDEIFASISKNAKSASESIQLIGKTDVQKADLLAGRLEKLKKQRDELQASSGSRDFFGGLIQRGSGFDKLFGFSRDDDIERQKKIRDLNKEIGDIIEKQKTTTAEAGKEKIEKEKQAAGEIRANDQQRKEKTKELAEYERDERRAKMRHEERIADLQKEQQANAKELAVYDKERKAGAELTAYGAERVLELKKRQVEIEREIKEATEKKQEAEANIAKAVEKQNQLLTVQFEIRGRDNSQLSDRELASKASNLRQSLLESKLRDMAPVGLDVFGASLVTSLDPLKFFKEQELASLLAVQRERATVRRNAAFFGEDRAFQMSGLSEQQFRDILAGEISNAEARRTADATEELVRLLSTGQGRMATVVLNPTPSS